MKPSTPPVRRSRLPGGGLSVLGLLLLFWSCGGPQDPETDPGAVAAGDVQGAQDPVDFSFVFFGCNRVGWDPSVPTASTANVAQLEQTLKDIAALQSSAGLPAPPRYLFMLGDLVRNEVEDDGSTLKGQLAAWQTLWNGQKSLLPKTQLVPVPGNHEVLYSVKVHDPPGCDCDHPTEENPCSCWYNEVPNPPTYDVWLQWIKSGGHGPPASNGPTPSSDPGDLLARDSSKLTYSFDTPRYNDKKKAHFVLVDTDALSTFRTKDSSCRQGLTSDDDPLPGWIAAEWIEKDIAAAEADPTIDLIFAMGHKPARNSRTGEGDPQGRDTIINCANSNCGDADCEPAELADRFVAALQSSSKSAGYLTSHDHTWKHLDLGGLPQIIAGNAGSPPDSDAPYFGFTLVTVHKSGKVVATSYGRPIPDPIDDPRGVGPATAQKTVVLKGS